MMFLAQLQSVPAETFKWVIIILIGLLGVAYTIVRIIKAFQKKRTRIEPQPLEVRAVAKRFNYDLAEDRHMEITRRLEAHDAEIDSIWNTFRAEDTAIRAALLEARERNASRFEQIAKSLGRIEGRLGIPPAPEA